MILPYTTTESMISGSSSSSTSSLTQRKIFQAFRQVPACYHLQRLYSKWCGPNSCGTGPFPTLFMPFFLFLISLLTILVIGRHTNLFGPDYSNRQNTYIIHYGYTNPDSCALHGFTPRTNGRAQVYDITMFNREFEVLELRLRELSSVVDKFIIVESDRSHAGVPKPLYFWENRHKYSEFLDRIVHIVHRTNETEPYVRERLQRIEGYQEGIKQAGVKKDDLIIVADGDEIPRASVIQTLRHCKGYPHNLCLASRSYYLSFEFQHSTYWHYPNIVTYDPIDKFYIGDYRTDVGVCIADAGWHCSYCFSDAERVLNKLASTMHVADGINSESRRTMASNYDALYQRYCDGEDPLNGAWNHYEVQQSLVGLPEWVLKHQEEYQWLLPGKCRKGKGQSMNMEANTGVRR